ncbi:oligosaccharide flippase family protein [Phocaeicola sp.]|uniref:lipopolysaccharide biosynthesis protein n=1 Tax=Phocaeicola sp. TaxID=2773926 RepID=UPI0023BBD2B6|nr:oligosaccharide flippase family protein [Phocaeicola sp.]MDE5678397.1 oligosaccharide flippase family protein [Phocaeicola sp.]
MQPGNRIILNTFILYTKMIFSILIGLISTRLILKALGIEDYGIYNLVAGVVSMLSFLNTSLATSTQRFLSIVLGKNDNKFLSEVFRYSLVLHFLVGIVVVLVVALLGRYGIEHVLSIHSDKRSETLLVLYFLSGSVFFSILSVPYVAVLISRENMLLLSIFEIAEICLKLLGAIILLFYSGDRLILYAAVTASIMFVSFVLKSIICRCKYSETRFLFQPFTNMELVKELVSFTGWYTFASIGSIGRFQGLQVLLNVFYGVVTNAAYGIANQVNGLMQFFATAILQSIRPQIMKSEGAHDRMRVTRLSLIACRYMFFLCAIFSIPMILEMPYVLHLWLDNPPEYTVGFCRLVLLATLLYMITSGLATAVDATGNIKWMYICLGCLHILNLPIGYFLLHYGASPYSVLWLVVGEEIICMCVRIGLAKYIVGIPVKIIIKKVMLPVGIMASQTLFIGIIIINFLEVGFIRTIITFMSCLVVSLVSVWYCGTEQFERERIKAIMCNMKFKLLK